MAIKVRCPNCGQKLRVPDAKSGTRGTCPKCGALALEVEDEADPDATPPLDCVSAAVRPGASVPFGAAPVPAQEPFPVLPLALPPPALPLPNAAPRRRSIFGFRGTSLVRKVGPGPDSYKVALLVLALIAVAAFLWWWGPPELGYDAVADLKRRENEEYLAMDRDSDSFHLIRAMVIEMSLKEAIGAQASGYPWSRRDVERSLQRNAELIRPK